MSNRLTIKGQVTIPKNVRDFLGLTEGASSVEFSIEPDGSVRVCKAVNAPRRVLRTEEVADTFYKPRGCDRVLAMLAGNFA